MKRIIAMCASSLVLALSFCACSNNAVSRGTTVTTVPGPAKPAFFEQIVFAVDADAEDAIFLAAQSFCRKVNTLSKSGLTLTASRYPDAMAAFKSGEANFALLDGRKAAALDPFFKITNENFRYKSYEHFSVSCNSAPVLKALSEKIGATVFAAYYTGSDYFISGSTLDSVMITSKSGDEATPPTVFTLPGSGAGDALAFLGAVPEKTPLFSQRLAASETENAVAEITLDELAGLTPPDFQDTRDEYLDLILTRSFHSVEPIWLILSTSLYESLTPPERAAIDEAAAYMTADIDHAFLDRETEALDLLGDANITISDDFSLVQSRILRNKNRSLTEISPDERYFRRLLDNIL